MNNLTPDQAQALWAAGGFIVVSNLPEGSEYGVDGVFHTTLAFSGTKFLPPGLHLISWSAPTSTPRRPFLDTGNAPAASGTAGTPSPSEGHGPGAIPLRQALFILSPPRGRYLLRYSTQLETLVLDKDAILSDDHLKSLDKSMAPYPFHALDGWKALTGHIGQETLQRVLGEEWKVDGLTRVDGEIDEVHVPQRKESARVEELQEGSEAVERPKHQIEEEPLKFTLFDSKRSWQGGAVGEEVTRYSADKSWLLGDVLRRLDNDPFKLIAELQLAFVLVLNLSSFGALQVFKRVVQIICRASDIHIHPTVYAATARTVRQLYIASVQTLAAQLTALPEGVFDTELPELDVWLLGEIDALRSNVKTSVRSGVRERVWAGESSKAVQVIKELETAWGRLIQAGRRYHWEIERLDLQATGQAEIDEESEEEGEYAPIVVDM